MRLKNLYNIIATDVSCNVSYKNYNIIVYNTTCNHACAAHMWIFDHKIKIYRDSFVTLKIKWHQ
jgi:hypothetical protein